ncbi:MAG: hypothetical protein ACKOBD_00245 [Chloroflexota bacterium]
MSKLSTRVILAVLLSMGVVVGVFMTVNAASSRVEGKSMGMYVLSGGLVNQLQSQSASEAQEEAQPQIAPYPGNKGEGQGGCESEKYNDPSDL